MNFIRLIKMKKINGDLDNLSDGQLYILSNLCDYFYYSVYIRVNGKKVKSHSFRNYIIYYEEVNEVWGSFNLYIKLMQIMNIRDYKIVDEMLLDFFKNKLGLKETKLIDAEYQ